MEEKLTKKLRILADAAKYDASCASSGSKGRRGGKEGLGSTTGAGICHAYTPDGRCVSLLKILLTNYCLFDCAYCINRRSSNVARARFSVEEVVTLTLEFYRRNYIEGLFLSSGIIKSPDHTMELLMRVAKVAARSGLCRLHPFEIDPGSQPLADRAGGSLCRPHVDQSGAAESRKPEAAGTGKEQRHHRLRHGPDAANASSEAKEERRRFAPAGQSTQVIVGADDASDDTVLARQRHTV